KLGQLLVLSPRPVIVAKGKLVNQTASIPTTIILRWPGWWEVRQGFVKGSEHLPPQRRREKQRTMLLPRGEKNSLTPVGQSDFFLRLVVRRPFFNFFSALSVASAARLSLSYCDMVSE